ncbi:fibronectin type III domain-containing protein [Rugosimonospora africana]|uniref:Fibronectin type-III domain-containing protein n=1 Tax=Rugosimonospora africana TaxID=556532 RepID=A0A8J3VUP2_9ACTN|nr:fibronectin type III domain-containing protein [Rugosimonospora africana]GIH18853.1 hypothetical protein Raf01_70250 [Rugosimonospora africana]
MVSTDHTRTGQRPGGGADDRVTVARGRQESTVARAVRVLRTERLAGITAVGAVAVLIVSLVGFGGGAHSVLPRIADIGAWLANDSQGSVTHANGLSGKADTRVTLTNAAGHPLKVIQDGDTVLVEDTVTGTVTRIDPAQLTVTQSVSYGSAGVQVVAGGGKAYVVDPVKGLVQPIDPDRLSVIGPPVGLTAPLGTAAVDGHGTAWVPVLRSGQLTPVSGGTAGAPVTVGSPGDLFTLTIAAGTPVVTDVTSATMTVLVPGGGRRTVNLPTGPGGPPPATLLAPASTDGAVIPLLATGSHQMVVVDTAAGRPTSVNLDGFDRDDLGGPETLGGRVYIPDNTTGRLIVYDSASGRLLNQVNVSGRSGRLNLFLNDGMLWANDASGAAAVSVDSAGAVHTISKYTPDLPGGPLPHASPTPTQTSGGGSLPGPGDDPGRRGNSGNGGNQSGGGNGQSGAGGQGGGGAGGGGGGRGGNPPPPVTRSSPPAPPTTKPPTTQPAAPKSPSPKPPATTPAGAPPDSAHGVSETPGPGYIDVKFSPSSGATPTSYTLSGLPSGASVSPDSVPAGGPYSFHVTGLACTGTPYKFTVVANYSTGPKQASGGGAQPCLVPSMPRSLKLNGSTQRQIGVSWQAPSSDGGAKVTYTVKGGGKTLSASGTSATITGLTNFSSYTVTVAAKNGAGSSQPPAQGSVQIAHNVNGHLGGDALYGVNVRSSTSASGTGNIVHTFDKGSTAAVTVKCEKNGGSWTDPTGSPTGDTWYQVTSPYAGYIATAYVTGASGAWNC